MALVEKRIDKLGRIVIPLELRKKYGLNEGTSVDFVDEGEGVTVKPSDPFCKICRNRISEDALFPLCETCIAKIVKENQK